MQRTLATIIFLVTISIVLYVIKTANDVLVSWAVKTYDRPTATYLVIVEYRFFELGLSSITTCYAFNLYFYLFHRKVFEHRDSRRSFALDLIMPVALLVPLLFLNHVLVFITKDLIAIPTYVRTVNSVYATVAAFICISYVIVKHIYGINWRMLSKITRHLVKYLEHIVIYVAVGFIVYAFLTILIVNTAYMYISRAVGAEASVHAILSVIPVNFLEAIILYAYFLVFLEPFINDVKLDAIMKKHAQPC